MARYEVQATMGTRYVAVGVDDILGRRGRGNRGAGRRPGTKTTGARTGARTCTAEAIHWVNSDDAR